MGEGRRARGSRRKEAGAAWGYGGWTRAPGAVPADLELRAAFFPRKAPTAEPGTGGDSTRDARGLSQMGLSKGH